MSQRLFVIEEVDALDPDILLKTKGSVRGVPKDGVQTLCTLSPDVSKLLDNQTCSKGLAVSALLEYAVHELQAKGKAIMFDKA